MVPPSEVQDIPLGDRPVEGQAWHSIAKGERALVAGDSSDVDRHLGKQGLVIACPALGIPSPTFPSLLVPKLPLCSGNCALVFPNLTRAGQMIWEFDIIQTTHIGRIKPPPCHCHRGLCM